MNSFMSCLHPSRSKLITSTPCDTINPHAPANGLVLSDKDSLDSKLDDCACTKITGHQGRVKDSITVSADSACITQTINFRMHDRVVFLNAPVMSPSNNLPIFYQNRTDWNSSLAQSLFCLINSCLHKDVHNFSIVKDNNFICRWFLLLPVKTL